MSILGHLQRVHRHNVATLKHDPLAEVSGALGDLGTLLPLMIALAVQGSILIDSTLIFSGVFNVVTGFVFGVPLPVQPMKAIAAAAISRPEAGDMATVISAGQWVSLAVLLMSVTGMLRFATQRVPVPVVKGIQLGAGLSLVMSAGSSLLVKLHWTQPAVDNRLWALAAFLVLIATQSLRRFPYALCIFLLSLLLATVSILTHRDDSRLPWFHVWHPAFSTSLNWLSTTSISMAVGQLPLTTLNSVIAVSALSTELLPNMPTPSVTSLGFSVGMMNLIGGWFGAMPVCHGAGGLAAQFRFGARSGSSIIMLGIFKILLGLFFGGTLIDLLSHYPKSLLGIMVVAAGLELAKVGNSLNQGAPDLLEQSVQDDASATRRSRDTSEEERAERWTVMLMTTAGILAFRNDAVGFLAGMLCHGAYRLSDAVREWYHSRRGQLGERAPLLR